MSGAPASAQEQIRRRVLGEAYAFAISVARRQEPDPPADTNETADAATSTASKSSRG
jgi:hypothetical protein